MRQMMEYCRSRKKNLHMNFIDLRRLMMRSGEMCSGDVEERVYIVIILS